MTKKNKIELIIKHIIEVYDDLGTGQEYRLLIDNSIVEILEITKPKPRKIDPEKVSGILLEHGFGNNFCIRVKIVTTLLNVLIGSNKDIWQEDE
ncbi:hypothetical protein KAR91_81570 [Candidatus Pacearchaeota archaeon]|nr:hypothetical protein [Candidatus Pacearchaeota archaeon]